jgi:hypothetical protein
VYSLEEGRKLDPFVSFMSFQGRMADLTVVLVNIRVEEDFALERLDVHPRRNLGIIIRKHHFYL